MSQWKASLVRDADIQHERFLQLRTYPHLNELAKVLMECPMATVICSSSQTPLKRCSIAHDEPVPCVGDHAHINTHTKSPSVAAW
jgi:hypothetical protein